MPPRKYAVTRSNALAWAARYASVKIWLSKQNNAKPLRALSLWYFCDWAKLDPETLVTLKEDPKSLAAERLLDTFTVESSFPPSTRRNTAISVRSFFRCNYRELQREAGKIDYVPQRPCRKPDREKLLRAYRDGCYNQRDRALVAVISCSAMALETLSMLTWSHFEPGWEAQDIPHISLPPECIKGHGKGKYQNVRQETFLTPEARVELIKYRCWMTRRYGVRWTEDMHVFLSVEQPHEALTYFGLNRTVKNISEKSGVAFSVHDGRRIVQTALESVSTSENWIRKVKGRKVRGEEAPYSKPAIEQLRGKYREALHELEFLSPAEAPKMEPPERFLAEFAEILNKYPEKAQKFERFILNL